MCILCVEIQRDKMTFKEVYNAMGEFVIPDDHKEELMKVIDNKWGSDSVWKITGENISEEGAD